MSRFWLGVLCFFGGMIFSVIAYLAIYACQVLREGKAADELAEEDDFASPPGDND